MVKLIETCEEWDNHLKCHRAVTLFVAEGCGPCESFKQVFDLADSFPGVSFGIVDADNEDIDLPRVDAVPLVVFTEDRIVQRVRSGSMSAQKFEEWLKEIL